MFALEDPVVDVDDSCAVPHLGPCTGEILSFGMHFGNLFTDLKFDKIIYYFITIKSTNQLTPHTRCNFKCGIQIATAVAISTNICWETHSRLTAVADPGFLRPAVGSVRFRGYFCPYENERTRGSTCVPYPT